MLVSHLCRFIYLKTIKTGSTSVEIYFEPWCVPPAKWRGEQHARAESVSEWGIVGARGAGDGFVRPDCTWYNHMPAAEVRDKVGPAVWDSYFKFCVIRDPYDKVVSQFWYHLSPAMRDHLARADFAEVRRAFNAWLPDGTMPSDRHIYTIDARIAVDEVIRYERMQPDLERICRGLRLPWQPHRLGNYKGGFRPRREPAIEYYDERSHNIAGSGFSWEIAQFGY
jgi:hypothetical protein